MAYDLASQRGERNTTQRKP